ncbi:MAG: hypothetical protein COT81_00005 [Candidatus Buchananbacteria bacterium CG10_big_fil_rev_8_21_14_0_10_42_9]|uniref:Uncharacterized protein n=1 Tax=Candidatus Buchananbacteria bacterium CG10_big_fil_rev_8_21_14_0_10_42_9 TaxID=1974526 RepID=A0A2H0W2T3_9BACT|nr:MAG: hypothetical protein COT81_00005 [Candidatus Buchananbacteria bacterium CG10_big_fil_rev_8_21_14_0_10_42_9]
MPVFQDQNAEPKRPIMLYYESMPSESVGGPGSPYHNVSNFQLKLSYWYITHKIQLRKILMVVLIIFDILIFSFVFWSIINLYFITYNDHQLVLRSLSQDLIDYKSFREAYAPVPLQIVGVRVITSSSGESDILVRVKNPNFKLAVSKVDYKIFADGAEVASGSTFVLPDTEKFFAGYNVANLARNADIQLQLEKVNWRRVDNYEAIAAERLRFEIIDTEYIPPNNSSIAGRLPVSIAQAEVRNNSAFNYWQVGFFTAVYSGQELVGVNYSTVEPFRSGETKLIEARWFSLLGNISQIEVILDVNILDPNSIMELELK